MTPILTYYFAVLFGYNVIVGGSEFTQALLWINLVTLSSWYGGKATENVISKLKEGK